MRLFSWKTPALLVVFGLSVFGSSCSKSKHNASPGVGGVTPGVTGDEGADDALNRPTNPTEEDYTAAYSVLNFRQLAAAYERATGVQMQGAVLAEFEKQLGSLPKDPDPTAVAASQVSAATKLAAVFCDVLSTNQQLRTARFPDIDFIAPVGNSSVFAETLLDGFFGPENSLQGERGMDIVTVAELVDFLLDKVPNVQTTSIFMGACAATLASAEFYLY